MDYIYTESGSVGMDNKCTIVVSSCDKYEDLWEPFFSILKANWPELDYQIVLNTETKKYKYPGLEIKHFHYVRILKCPGHVVCRKH